MPLNAAQTTNLAVGFNVVNPGGGAPLAAATYTGTITLTGTCSLTGTPAVGSPALISVNLIVTQNAAAISLSARDVVQDGVTLQNLWSPMSNSVRPAARSYHQAVWTGTKLIVWGGRGAGSTLHNTGGRYDPLSNTWAETSTGANVPSARERHAAVWTGSTMLVWGGVTVPGSLTYTNTGGRYDPAANTWEPMSTLNAPSGRYIFSTVWTGSRMMVWGGSSDGGSSQLNSGGRYDPATDSWQPISTTGAPSARGGHSAVWTGTRMIVWGGGGASGLTNTGAAYDPATDSWTPLSAVDAPAPRQSHRAHWTGSKMIVWGGSGFNSGGMYDPATDSWTTLSTTNAPVSRDGDSSVWTGTQMLVWGGDAGGSLVNTGALFDPISNAWVGSTTADATTPSPRLLHTATWTGARMYVWGGEGPGATLLQTGAGLR